MGGGCCGGCRTRRVNPHAVSSDPSIAPFRATAAGFKRSIKVLGYQIPALIDFPKPSVSRWNNLKEPPLSRTNQEPHARHMYAPPLPLSLSLSVSLSNSGNDFVCTRYFWLLPPVEISCEESGCDYDSSSTRLALACFDLL